MPRPLVKEDLLKLRFVSAPELSPCGERVAFVLTHIDEKTEEYRSYIYMQPVNGGAMHKLTGGGKIENGPKFSPDGKKLAFVSDRNGDKQIFVLDLKLGGEARQVTTMRFGAASPTWSPDGRHLAYISRFAQKDTALDLEKARSQQERDEDDKKRREEPKVIGLIKHKADEAMGLLDMRHSHIWLISAEGGKARCLTSGDFEHVDPCWSPCGQDLAFASNRDGDPEFKPYYADIYTVRVATGEIKRITAIEGPSSSPIWSPDGKSIAYMGHTGEFYSATLTRVWLISADGGEPVNLTAQFDRSVGDQTGSDTRYGGGGEALCFSSDGASIYFLASDRGDTHVYRVSPMTREVLQLTTGHMHMQSMSCSADGKRISLAASAHLYPTDLFLWEHERPLRRLTEVNQALLSEVALSEPDEFWFKGAEGWDIQGWLMKPTNFAPGQKYPLVLEIHGGPHTQYGCTFFMQLQLWANAGYGVVFTNPRGSQGYGQVFANAVRGDYGGGDYQDLMCATDYAAKLPWVDSERLGVTGGSYGGFMTNWIVGHTKRFKSAITLRSISNWLSFYGVSDIGYTFTEYEILGNPWDNTELLLKHSPISYVKQVSTPILIVHAEQDMRCPIEQGEQFYVYLKKLGVKTRMVRFPGANHELSRSGKPKLRLARLEHLLEWFRETL
ncbi:MAG: Dipeptidyl-peptidase 5 [Firmicutes bacterium]|nr:Dipeptidyl-peptidase 5 [candidate division NPL-UPA2 bacterium]